MSYAANRGKDDIVCYEVDRETGDIFFAGRYDAQAKMVRTFTLTDKYIILAGQDSGKVVVRSRDEVTGALGGVVDTAAVPEAAFVSFL